MNDFLTSNKWQWRFLRTVVQGVLGVVVANLDMLVGCARCSTPRGAPWWWGL